MLLDDLRTFLMNNGFTNVFKLQYPEKLASLVSLHERESPMAFGASGINYGARTAPTNIRVANKDSDSAEADAWRIFSLLDSGPNERLIQLTNERTVTGRPIPPIFLEIDKEKRWVWVVKVKLRTRTTN